MIISMAQGISSKTFHSVLCEGQVDMSLWDQAWIAMGYGVQAPTHSELSSQQAKIRPLKFTKMDKCPATPIILPANQNQTTNIQPKFSYRIVSDFFF